MTSFYNKYLLNNSEKKVILKKDFTLDYTDYEKLKMSEQYNKLYSNIYDKNKTNITINENKKIYNLSLKELFLKSSTVYLDILNDLSIYFSKENKEKSINSLGLILTKNDNLLYIGLFILILSFFLWLIQITT